ncbi:MAG: hypothetical protein LUH02_00575 [Erysipelotrichaceae bacterium]|nr:hypothetical protein [Erysipelotrichaceae bacterium]
MKKLLKMLLVGLLSVMLVACGGSDDKITFETFSWPTSGLALLLPEPPSDNGTIVGEINYNNEDSLSIDIGEISKDDFLSYIDACIEKGFSVDSESNDSKYEAYDETGNELTLYYYEDDAYYNINLQESKVTGTFSWPTVGLATLLPEPKSNVGTIETDSSTSFTIYVGESTEDDISNYINECLEAGFDVDYSRDNTSLRAENDAGLSLSIDDEGFNIMYIHLYGDEDEVNAALGKSTSTSTDSSESSNSSTSSSSSSSNSSSGISTEFKEAMDSYEDFFDEYIAFMEKYAESDDSLSMLADYSSYLSQYSETMQKMDAIDEDDLSDEELAYYLEVTARITKKLSEADI